ncbi:MAG: hypothetical protein U0X39_01710 [Bacteroidales bacterium]
MKITIPVLILTIILATAGKESLAQKAGRLPSGSTSGAYYTGKYRDLFLENGHARKETRMRLEKE